MRTVTSNKHGRSTLYTDWAFGRATPTNNFKLHLCSYLSCRIAGVVRQRRSKTVVVVTKLEYVWTETVPYDIGMDPACCA
jgi:hypothetical protein